MICTYDHPDLAPKTASLEHAGDVLCAALRSTEVEIYLDFDPVFPGCPADRVLEEAALEDAGADPRIAGSPER